jgi:hypothetical protein
MSGLTVATIQSSYIPWEDREFSAYAVRSVMSRHETGLNPRQQHRSNENTVTKIIQTKASSAEAPLAFKATSRRVLTGQRQGRWRRERRRQRESKQGYCDVP